jgi:putative transcriptional regulator
MRNKVKMHRVLRDMTQEQLAQAIQVSRQTIHAIESGKYVPSTLLALKLAEVLDTEMHHLFELEEDDWKA